MRDLTKAEITSLIHAKCAICGSHLLEAGAEAGVSLNIYCADCKAGFNLMAFGELGGQLIQEPRLRLGRVER